MPRWFFRPAGLGVLERGTLAERAADQIRRRIVLGELRHGQRLEGMRILARELHVSVTVVREAIAELRGAGFVEVRHGVGIFVARRMRRAGAVRAARAMRRRRSLRELEELRRALEPVIARAAAERLTDHRLREIGLWAEQRASAAMFGDASRFTEADTAMHVALARGSGNSVAAGEHWLLMTLLRPELEGQAGRLASDRRLGEWHEELVDAIEAGHAERAADLALRIARRESGEEDGIVGGALTRGPP
ncbi:MAG TPA: FCD domain-containing protein [Candidatus Limnocylindria bacterium]